MNITSASINRSIQSYPLLSSHTSGWETTKLTLTPQKNKNYFTSSDPHHDMLGGGCQVRVVIKNMMGRMENLRTLISGFLGLVILVRWALVTMFLSWTTQTGCRIHRTYVSLIGSGEGRHTTHLLKCVLLLSTSQTDWKQSSDVLSDISFDILSDISSDISSDILSDISSDILSDIFLTYLLTFFLANLLTLFLTYLLTFFLTYLSTCFLTYLLTFFLTYQNQNLTSTASQKKPLCKLYIYLAPRSKSNIHDNFAPVNVIALSASDRPAKRQLSPKMQNACSSTHTHTTCIRPPRQKAVESKNAKEFEVPQLHLMACANHEVRCSPLRCLRRFCIGGPAPHVVCLPFMHSILPKRGRSTKDCSALLQLLLALRIWNRPPFICHIPLVSLHDFFHDKHQIPSMCSARRLHAHVHALSTNKSQLVAPHMLNSFGNLIGSPNEDRLRTFHHNLRHGFQTKLTSLHKNKVEPTVLAAVCQIKQKTRCHPQDSVGANMNSCSPDLCMHIYLGHIFWRSAWYIFWHSFWHIFWHSFWHLSDVSFCHSFWQIFWHSFWWHIFWHIFLTYLSPFFLTYLLTLFLTYLPTYLSDISSDILFDISSDILSDISFDILSAISSGISPDILWDISFDILSGISSDILSDISFDILSDILSDISCAILSDISPDILFDISFGILSDMSSHILSDISSDILSDISSDILSDIFLTYLLSFFLTYFLTLFLTYLLTFFLTYLLTFFPTYHLTFFLPYLLTYLSDISSDISSDILSDIFLSFFLTYLLTFFLTYLSPFFLTYLLAFFLTYLLTFFLTYLLTFLLTYLLTFFLTYLLTFFLTYLLTFFLTYLLTFFLTYLLTFFLTYLLTFFLTYLLTYLSDISSGILFDISFWQIFCHSFWQIFWHNTWGPARHTELTGSRLGSGPPHWTHEITVGVRHATLKTQDRGWGPARHTALTRIAVVVQHATLNSQDRSWAPACHTELTESRQDKVTEEDAEEDAEEKEKEKRLT